MGKIKPSRITRLEDIERRADYRNMSVEQVKALKEVELLKCDFEQARALADEDGFLSGLELTDAQLYAMLHGDMSPLTDWQLERLAGAWD
jgi:hypothetical protein